MSPSGAPQPPPPGRAHPSPIRAVSPGEVAQTGLTRDRLVCARSGPLTRVKWQLSFTDFRAHAVNPHSGRPLSRRAGLCGHRLPHEGATLADEPPGGLCITCCQEIAGGPILWGLCLSDGLYHAFRRGRLLSTCGRADSAVTDSLTDVPLTVCCYCVVTLAGGPVSPTTPLAPPRAQDAR